MFLSRRYVIILYIKVHFLEFQSFPILFSFSKSTPKVDSNQMKIDINCLNSCEILPFEPRYLAIFITIIMFNRQEYPQFTLANLNSLKCQLKGGKVLLEPGQYLTIFHIQNIGHAICTFNYTYSFDKYCLKRLNSTIDIGGYINKICLAQNM